MSLQDEKRNILFCLLNHDFEVEEALAMLEKLEQQQFGGLLEACKEAEKLIEIARGYFPKSMHNSDRFQLEKTCAAIGSAIALAEKSKS